MTILSSSWYHSSSCTIQYTHNYVQFGWTVYAILLDRKPLTSEVNLRLRMPQTSQINIMPPCWLDPATPDIS
jgi:hypothetical protein